MEVWFLTVLGVAALAAFVRNSALVRRLFPRNAGADPGAFERFWSRVDGRAARGRLAGPLRARRGGLRAGVERHLAAGRGLLRPGSSPSPRPCSCR